MSSIAHLFFKIEPFYAKHMLKILYIVNKNLVFDKREVYWLSFIIGLSAKLYGRVISKLPKYWPASNKLFDYKIWTLSLGIRFEAETSFYHPSNCTFFSFWVFFCDHSWITGLNRRGRAFIELLSTTSTLFKET